MTTTKSSKTAPVKTQTNNQPYLTLNDWAQLLLAKLNINPTTNQNSLNSLLIWAQGEGGSFNNTATNNVLNTTQKGSGYYVNQGLPAYQTLSEGINATAETLKQPQFSSILNGLKQNAPTSITLTAIQNSPWAQSHYGYKLADQSVSSSFGTTPLNSFKGTHTSTQEVGSGTGLKFNISNAGSGNPSVVQKATVAKVTSSAPTASASSGNWLVDFNNLMNAKYTPDPNALLDVGAIVAGVEMIFFRGVVTFFGFLILIFGLAMVGLNLIGRELIPSVVKP